MRKPRHQHQVFININPNTGNFLITIDNDKPAPICNRCLYNIMNNSAPISNFCVHCAEVMSVEDKAKRVSKTMAKNK